MPSRPAHATHHQQRRCHQPTTAAHPVQQRPRQQQRDREERTPPRSYEPRHLQARAHGREKRSPATTRPPLSLVVSSSTCSCSSTPPICLSPAHGARRTAHEGVRSDRIGAGGGEMWESVALTLAGTAGNNIGKVLQKKGTLILPPLSLKLKVFPL